MNKRSLKLILLKALYIIIIPIIIYNLLIIVQTLVNPDVVPNIFGFKTFDIASSSMSPMLNINDIAIIKKFNDYDLKEGDVITYRTN